MLVVGMRRNPHLLIGGLLSLSDLNPIVHLALHERAIAGAAILSWCSHFLRGEGMPLDGTGCLQPQNHMLHFSLAGCTAGGAANCTFAVPDFKMNNLA